MLRRQKSEFGEAELAGRRGGGSAARWSGLCDSARRHRQQKGVSVWTSLVVLWLAGRRRRHVRKVVQIGTAIIQWLVVLGA